MKTTFRHAFTLIELLVVVAIIGILAALLLPALAHAKAKGRQIQCLNDLKQLGIAVHLYADENDDFVPRENGIGSTNPWFILRSLTNGNVWYNAWLLAAGKNAASNYADTTILALQQEFYLPSSLLACPSARFEPVSSMVYPQFSRAMNSRVMIGVPLIRLSDLTQPSITPLLLDAGVPGETPLPNQLPYDGRPHVKWDRASARHRGFANAVFGDASARVIPAGELIKPLPQTFRWER
jgi:prepilin-type N-terminal cleavage/methylation domain-containing protein